MTCRFPHPLAVAQADALFDATHRSINQPQAAVPPALPGGPAAAAQAAAGVSPAAPHVVAAPAAAAAPAEAVGPVPKRQRTAPATQVQALTAAATLRIRQ